MGLYCEVLNMRQGKNHYADKRRELTIAVDVKLSKEPAHCHLYYKGELVGCILLEAEAKNKVYKTLMENGFLSLFKKASLRPQFDFIPEVDTDKLRGFIDRYQEDSYRHAHLGSEINEEDTKMIIIATKFAEENLDMLLEEQKAL